MPSLVRRLTAGAALTAATLLTSFSTAALAQTAQFGQQPIAADRVVAVAEPVNNGRFYSLLILEQLGTVRPCWREEGSSPTTIEPLLLTFDFSGICGRSSDSNGYSLRIAGEDFNTRYRLQMVQREGYLALVATPSAMNRSAPTLEIGRTNGIANDFLKIQLNPGWEMNRRVYNGQVLGHIYVTNNQPLDAVIAANGVSGGSSRPTPPTTTPPTGSPPTPGLPTPPGGRPLPAPGTPGVQGDFIVIVPGNSDLIRNRVQSVEPGAFRTTINGQTVIQAGRFQEQARAEELLGRLQAANLSAQIVRGNAPVVTPPRNPNPPSSGDISYQVVVPGGSELLRSRVAAIAPGAFRTTVNGQQVIQAGIFQEQARAEEVRQRLAAANLNAQIITTNTPIVSNPGGDRPPVPNGQIVVVIDPGHGGRDPGAVGIGGLQEKELTTWFSQRVQAALEARGIRTVLTRSDDREIDLQPRVDIAERANATIFVSIHANAISLSRPEVNGLETYYYSSGLTLARLIHSSVLANSDIADRGVRQARFYVIRNTSMPAVLVETGFVTGRDDVDRFLNLSRRQQIADGIAEGIITYLQQYAGLAE
jgi:N-acetylmuramoyl-L-alanine amidase